MKRNVCILCVLVAASAGCSRERYGIVARLGNDTISIERITRTGKRVVSDVAERSPRAMRKHWEALLNPDGSVRRFILERHLLNPAPSETPVVKSVIDFTADSVIMTVDSAGTARRSVVPRTPHVDAPWNPYVYGTYELLFEAASHVTGDSIRIHQFIPGFGRGHGVVRRRREGGFALVSTRLAGTGLATLNERGRLVSYDGRNTTYQQLVQRVDGQPDIDRVALHFAELEKKSPGSWLSMRDTTNATVGAATVTIDYGRPRARGRTILGDVVPYNRVWRTGANAATQLTTTAPISIAGIKLAPGTYTLWTLPTQDSVVLIINKQSGQWGTSYRPEFDLARARLTVENTTALTEAFTIDVEQTDARSGALVLEWDHFRWTAPIAMSAGAPAKNSPATSR